jgi:hypothetical protein
MVFRSWVNSSRVEKSFILEGIAARVIGWCRGLSLVLADWEKCRQLRIGESSLRTLTHTCGICVQRRI